MRKAIFCLVTMSFLAICFVLWPGVVTAGPDDVVKAALEYDPTTLNILEMKTGIDLPVILSMHNSLLGTDPETGNRTFERSLTKSARVMENGKDIRIIMSKGFTFHTGDPVTAHDIKWTYAQCVNPDNANLMGGPLEEIEEIEVIDDYNLIFRFYEPYAAWMELLWIGISSKNYYEKVGKEKFRQHPVGSGPFRFVEREVGASVTLEAYKGYTWIDKVKYYDKKSKKTISKKVEQKVDFNTLKFLIVQDEITRIAMLETGELDLINHILPHNLKRLKQKKHIKIKRESRVPSLYALSYKPDNYPIFKDNNFSRAFYHAINRQEIIDNLFLGEGYPLYLFAAKSELGYDPKIVFEFNPDKARKLIQQSSYKPGTPITLSYTSAVPNSQLIVAIIQKYMKDVGVNIKLQQLEAGVQATYSRNRDPKEGHMTLYAWAGGRDPSTRLILTLPSDSIYNNWRTRKNKELIDTLTFAQARETNKKKRLAILSRIHKLLRQEPGGGTILFGLNEIYAMNDRIDYNWLPKSAFLFNTARIKVLK
ncbi:MAG: ABC transporter substrate-binding protein [Deltaproteobacteria bacterium]|nr:ABC transporter substrate-binding protein [Deltaproteobacteria bacterium]